VGNIYLEVRRFLNLFKQGIIMGERKCSRLWKCIWGGFCALGILVATIIPGGYTFIAGYFAKKKYDEKNAKGNVAVK